MDNMRMFIGKDTISVSEAMQRIDNNGHGILFLVDAMDQIVGCITDGDIRRFLLAGGGMSETALAACNKTPKVAHNKREAKALFNTRNLILIPIVDKNGVVLDLYAEESVISKRLHDPINLPVVINAGGKGTRLDPFTRIFPKPLIPVGDIPIIEHIMKKFQAYGCDEFHIIVNYKRELLKAFLFNTGMYIVEPEVVDDIEDGVCIGFPDIVTREKEKGRKVAAFPISETEWMDMGQLPELEKMRIKLYGE